MKSIKFLNKYLFNILLILLTGMLFSNQTLATHASGADFTYKCLGGNQFELKLTFYRDCSGITGPGTVPIILNSTSCSLNFNYSLPLDNIQGISAACFTTTCSGGTAPGVERYIYIDTVTIADPCPDFIFSFSQCCRNNVDNLVNPGTEDIYIESFLDNSVGLCNSSPVFSTLGVNYLCANRQSFYNFTATDVDGDSLAYSLVNSLGALGNPIAYVGAYSASYPILTTSGSVDLDSAYGTLSFTPSIAQSCAITVLVEEYRNGILIGSIMRDIQAFVINCPIIYSPAMSSPGILNVVNGIVLDTMSVELCVGDSLSFDIVFSDANTSDILTLTDNIAADFPGANMVSSGTNPLSATFTWTPSTADIGLQYLDLQIMDNGCPFLSLQFYSVEINVIKGPDAGPDIYLCLADTIQLNGYGGTSFQWSPSTGLSNDTIPNPLAYPSVTTTYTLVSNLSGNCDTVDTMTIFVVPSFTLSTSQDTIICLNETVQISAMVTPPGTYTYLWSPATNLSFDSISNPAATPSVSTNYQVSVTSSLLCTRTDSVNIDVASLAINPTVDDRYVCKGQSTVLHVDSAQLTSIIWTDPDSNVIGNAADVTISPTASGIYSVSVTNVACSSVKNVNIMVGTLDIGLNSISLCLGDSFQTAPVFDSVGIGSLACGISVGCGSTGITSSVMVGNGTAVNSATSFPAPFGNWYKNAKHQILYTAADLISSGVTAGTITEIGFPVDVLIGTNLYQDYSIKLGCTDSTNLSTWIGGLSTVLPPTDITIVAGMNTIVLNTHYDWDGVSNLVMEICFDNLSLGYTNNSSSPYTVTGYTSVSYYRSDVLLACPSSAPQATSSNRPNMSFTICKEVYDPVFSWTPSTGVSNDTIVNPVLNPGTNMVLTLTFDNGICVLSDSVNVDVISSLALSGTSTGASCGLSDGTASVSTGNGSTPYIYSWNDGSSQTNSTATGLGAGNYTVNVSDSNGCTDTLVVIVSQAGAPTLSSGQIDVLCNGENTGIAYATASGGTPPYTYLWDDPGAQTTDTALGLPAGTYTVLVTANTCTSTASVTITEPSTLSVNASGVDPICSGDCNGSVSALSFGGVNPITYLWDDPLAQTTPSAIGLCAGIYTVVVVDANGCAESDTVTLTEPSGFTLTSTSQDLICGDVCDGMATVTPSGNPIPITYLWDDPASQSTATATGLCAGTYTALVSDFVGCGVVDTVTVTEPIVLSATFVTLPATTGNSDGSSTVSIQGGTGPYTYTWNDTLAQTNAAAINLSAGPYSVLITDSNGCLLSGTTTVPDMTGIWDKELGARFNVFPNPSTGMVYFDLEMIEVGGITIEVMDIIGSQVYKTSYNGVHLLQGEIDISDLSDGIYIVRLRTEKGILKRRIIISK